MDNKILIHSVNSPDVYHWGIHGQQWGKRRYQNEDGSLTPLGRIHYGVGEAKERSKIKIREMKAETKSAVKLAKAQAKAAKAVANAEKEKIAAKTKEYRDRKEADNIVELERIKAQREADRMDAKNEAQLNKNLAEASKENAEDEKSSSKAVKTVLGIMAAAGVGYLIYRAASHGEASASTREAAEEAIKKVSDKPINEVTNATYKYTDNQAKSAIDFYKNKLKNTTDPTEKAVTENFIKQLESSNSITTKASNAIAKAGSSDKNLVNLTLGKVSKSQQAEKAGKQFGDAALQRLEKFKSNVNAANKADAAARVKEAAHQFDIRLAAGNKEYAKNAANASKKVASGFTSFINRNSNKMESFEEWLKKNGKTVFTARHSDTDGLILVHSAKGPDVQHWGILGMKWGVRRYQNPDGTLTELGKQHYAKNDTKKFMKAKNYASKYKIANESEIIKDFKKNSDEYADLNKHYNELKSLGENVTEQQAKDFREVTRGVRQAAAEFIEKYSDEPANLMALYAWDDENRRAYEITKQSRIKIEREAMENLKKEDLFDEQRVKEDPKRANEAAITGLKALNKIGRDGYDENEGITKGDKEWFIWEDQTIGLATIADLVNQGKSSSEIKAIVKAANSINDDETTSSQSGVWQLANSGYSWRPEAIDSFIDACIEVKKEESKIKHSDYDGGNSICLTKLF